MATVYLDLCRNRRTIATHRKGMGFRSGGQLLAAEYELLLPGSPSRRRSARIQCLSGDQDLSADEDNITR